MPYTQSDGIKWLSYKMKKLKQYKYLNANIDKMSMS